MGSKRKGGNSNQLFNVDADTASRQFTPRVKWTLDPNIFQNKVDRLYLSNIDLLASRLSHQVERCVTRYPDPGAIAVNAFLQDWSKWSSFIHPPVNLLFRVVKKMNSQDEEASALVMTPNWHQLALVFTGNPNVSGLPPAASGVQGPFILTIGPSGSPSSVGKTCCLETFPDTGQVFRRTLSRFSSLHGVSSPRRGMLALGELGLNGVKALK